MVVYLYVSSKTLGCHVIFVFKQKTAYEMRISDWSSDVCSSDLGTGRRGGSKARGARLRQGALPPGRRRRRLAAGGALRCHPGDRRSERHPAGRSEERRVGKECVRTCRSRG